MTELELLRNRLSALERRVQLLGGLSGVFVLLGITAAVLPHGDVLRTRGLVIVDSTGRERIVIGAPIRDASTDPKLAQTVGMVVLDSAGRLHVSVGANNPLVFADGRTGTRIGTDAGMTIYDPRNGGERGGIGVFQDGRANVCLDWARRGKEAACMSVAPGDQYSAVLLNGTPDQPQFDRVGLFAGADGIGIVKAFGGGSNNGGIRLEAGKGSPVIALYDTTGRRTGNALERQ
jgi:hypothetical protein